MTFSFHPYWKMKISHNHKWYYVSKFSIHSTTFSSVLPMLTLQTHCLMSRQLLMDIPVKANSTWFTLFEWCEYRFQEWVQKSSQYGVAPDLAVIWTFCWIAFLFLYWNGGVFLLISWIYPLKFLTKELTDSLTFRSSAVISSSPVVFPNFIR